MHRAGLAATIAIGVVAATKVLVAVFLWLTAEADQYTPLGAVVADVLSGIWLVAYVVAAILFMLWMNRARRNAEAITPQQHRFRNVWVVIGWLIPVVNLYIPYAVMQDIWRASDRSQPTLGLQHREPSGLVLLWWICFLASNFSLTLSAQYGVALAVFATISALLSVAAAVLGAQVIRRLNAMQVTDQNAFPAPAA
ncbi:DUF4328 domain-containing protein [Lentzea terrae]|uniref:DUF4328 domain-containing protein n=1 Tax=Lentzea terrae TaxID=2200761 RepID=UPI000DD44F92|nr:DUF4328 domain-containing protein [Lentzea terrae]